MRQFVCAGVCVFAAFGATVIPSHAEDVPPILNIDNTQLANRPDAQDFADEQINLSLKHEEDSEPAKVIVVIKHVRTTDLEDIDKTCMLLYF
jgi:hypothetical protein